MANVRMLLAPLALGLPVVAWAQSSAAQELARIELVGRVQGLPAGTARVHGSLLLCGAQRSLLRSFEARMLEGGRFEAGLPVPAWPEALEYELHLWTADGSGQRLAARLEWRGRLPHAEHDLGDLYLVRPPRLAEGRVLDPAGAPLPGTRVRVEVLDADAAHAGLPRGHWRERIDLETRSRDDGTFAVVGLLGAGEGRLRLSVSDGANRWSSVVVSGAQGVELGIEGLEPFGGRVLVEEGVPLRAITVEVLRSGDGARARATPRADGSLAFDDLLPGSYDVSVFLRGESAPLWVERQLGVGHFGTLDLRGRIGVLTLRVVDPQGRPAASASVSVRPAGAEAFQAETRSQPVPGVWEFVTSQPALDLLIDDFGHRRKELLGVRGDVLVTLEPKLQVHARLAQRPSWLPAGAGIQLNLAQGLGLGGSALLDQHGQARIELRTAGPHAVSLSLLDPESGALRAFSHARLDWLVLDELGVQPFVLHIDEVYSQRLRGQWERSQR